MIFIPCNPGIRHKGIEDAKPEHIVSGCNVLLHEMLEGAGVFLASHFSLYASGAVCPNIYSFQLIRKFGVIVTLSLSLSVHAEETAILMREVFHPSPLAQTQLVVGISHLSFARDIARRTLLLGRCNWQQSPSTPLFEEFAATLVKEMGASNHDAITVFTVSSRIQEAVMQNKLTEDQVATIEQIKKSPKLNELLDYLSFQKAMSEIASGFSDPSTGNRLPWIAAKALAFIRDSKFYPLLLKNSNADDVALLNRRLLDQISPTDKFADDEYLDALTFFFAKEVATPSLHAKLPHELGELVNLHASLNFKTLYDLTLIPAAGAPSVLNACVRENTEYCVDDSWFEKMITIRNSLYRSMHTDARRVLNERYAALCQ